MSAGADIYNWQYQYSTYDKDSIGGNLRLGYPLIDYSRIFLTYNYDIADIKNVDDDAAISIKNDEGENIKSSITTRVKYDSRDDGFHPTEGSFHTGSYEFAGLGGTVGFNKIIGETAWYFPLIWKFVGVLHGKAGYVKELEGKRICRTTKSFICPAWGGLRGFERDDLAPRDDDGNIVGADKFVVGNVELRFPLFEQAGLYGAVFFDTGEAWGDDEKVDPGNLRESAGIQSFVGGHPWGRLLWGTVGFWIPNPPTKLPGIGSFPWPRLFRRFVLLKAGFSISL